MPTRSATAKAGATTIFVPGLLRDCCDGAAELTTTASTVRIALAHLETRFPALHRSVCDETGRVRRHINLFVNSDDIRDLDGLDSALGAGDVLTILPAISGG